MDKKLVTLNDYIEAGVMSKMAFNRYTLYDISIKDQNDMPLNINIPDIFNDCEVRYIAVDFYNKENVAFYLSTKKFREKRNFTVVNFINFVHANKMIGSSFNTEEYVNVRYRATTVDDILRDIYKNIILIISCQDTNFILFLCWKDICGNTHCSNILMERLVNLN